MHTYSYVVTIKEDGSLDLHTKIPEIKGERVRIIVVGPYTEKIGLTTDEIMKTVDKDWDESGIVRKRTYMRNTENTLEICPNK
ncbi:MAG: hypothetical protein ACUZ8N_15645 [Candidatus Scalindua sp.]